MNKSSFEQVLNEKGVLIYTNVGDSMLPFIRQNRDLLIIKKHQGRLQKYDVPLYKRDSGQYVLHRVLKVRQNDYVLCGDNRCNKEYGIYDRHIIGVLTAVKRNGRTINVTNRRYRIYVHLWCDFFPIRAAIIKLRTLTKKIKKRFRGKADAKSRY